jgi:hypothetical protein
MEGVRAIRKCIDFLTISVFNSPERANPPGKNPTPQREAAVLVCTFIMSNYVAISVPTVNAKSRGLLIPYNTRNYKNI